jgi:hypothetical protein
MKNEKLETETSVSGTQEELDLMDVSIFGVKIGTASGWDQISDHGVGFYNFVAEDRLSFVLPNCDCLTIDMELPVITAQFGDDTFIEISVKQLMEILWAE